MGSGQLSMYVCMYVCMYLFPLLVQTLLTSQKNACSQLSGSSRKIGGSNLPSTIFFNETAVKLTGLINGVIL